MTRRKNRWPAIHRPPVTRPVTARDVWFQVARIRERNGDTEGAARARRNARMQVTTKFRKKFADVQVTCFYYGEGDCPTLCQERAKEDGSYCIRKIG